MFYGLCEAFKQACCELSFVEIVLNFGVLSSPCRYAGYDPSSKLVVSYRLLNLSITLVFFHLHAGKQVTTLRSLQAKPVVSNRLINCA